MKKIFLSLFMIYSLSACGHLGKQFDGLETPDKNEAIIYYYRPNHFVGSGVYYDIKENGEKITTLYNGGYYPHKTAEGEKLISAETEKKKDFVLRTEKGKTYFIRGGVEMGILVGRPTLTIVQPEQALSEIEECRIIEQE